MQRRRKCTGAHTHTPTHPHIFILVSVLSIFSVIVFFFKLNCGGNNNTMISYDTDITEVSLNITEVPVL